MKLAFDIRKNLNLSIKDENLVCTVDTDAVKAELVMSFDEIRHYTAVARGQIPSKVLPPSATPNSNGGSNG